MRRPRCPAERGRRPLSGAWTASAREKRAWERFRRCSTLHAVNAHGRIRLVVRVRVRSWVDGATPTADVGTDALGKAGREVRNGWNLESENVEPHVASGSATAAPGNRSASLSLSKPSSLCVSSVFRLSTSKLESSGRKNLKTLREGSCYRIQAVTNEGCKVRLTRNEAVFSGTNRITMSMAEGGDRLWALERDVGFLSSLAGPAVCRWLPIWTRH